VPVSGGIVLCTTRMNKIVKIDAENSLCLPKWAVLNDLNLELAKQKLFFPPDPQSFLAATIGGAYRRMPVALRGKIRGFQALSIGFDRGNA